MKELGYGDAVSLSKDERYTEYMVSAASPVHIKCVEVARWILSMGPSTRKGLDELPQMPTERGESILT